DDQQRHAEECDIGCDTDHGELIVARSIGYGRLMPSANKPPTSPSGGCAATSPLAWGGVRPPQIEAYWRRAAARPVRRSFSIAWRSIWRTVSRLVPIRRATSSRAR